MIVKNLKQGKFKVQDTIVERYIVENISDLNKFEKEFKLFNKEVLITALMEGRTIIFTERNITGYNSYCFECKDKTSTHPGAFIRV